MSPGTNRPSGPRRLKVDADAFVVLHELLPGLALPPGFDVGWMLRLDDAERRSRRAAGLVRLAEAGLVLGTVDRWRLHPAAVAALAVQAAPQVSIQVHGWSPCGTLLACTAVSAAAAEAGQDGSSLARARRDGHDGPTVEVSTFEPRDVVAEVQRLVTQGVPLGAQDAADVDRQPFEMETHTGHAFACAVRDGAGQDLLAALASCGSGAPGSASGPGSDGSLRLVRGPRAGLHVLVTSAISSASLEHPTGASGWCEEWLADDTGWWRLVLRTDSAARPRPVDLLRCEPVVLDDLARALRFVLAGLLSTSAVRRG